MCNGSNDTKAGPIPKKINETGITARIQFLHLIDSGYVVQQCGNVVVGDPRLTDCNLFIASDDEWGLFRQNMQFARISTQKMFQLVVNGIHPRHAIRQTGISQLLHD